MMTLPKVVITDLITDRSAPRFPGYNDFAPLRFEIFNQ